MLVHKIDENKEIDAQVDVNIEESVKTCSFIFGLPSEEVLKNYMNISLSNWNGTTIEVIKSGAEVVQIGTAFGVSEENGTLEVYKNKILLKKRASTNQMPSLRKICNEII